MDKLPSAIHARLSRHLLFEVDELPALLWSFFYFFSLLCGYYLIRPLRDEMGIQGGVENLQWLFTGTLVAMSAAIPVFGWLTSRFSRQRFLPVVYLFFILNLGVFYLLMRSGQMPVATARAFFIWVSVFNLFVVSVFWSFMTDLFNNEQAKRLFGFIAAGGTLGALSGPGLAALLVQPLGNHNLLLVSALFLGLAILCIQRLSSWSAVNVQSKETHVTDQQEQPIEGGIWAGVSLVFRSPYLLGICLLMLLFTTLATFLYFMQAQIIRDAFSDSEQRTAVFAAIDLAVNGLTLLFQLVLTSHLIRRFGLPVMLAVIPVLLALGFSLLSFAPLLPVFLLVQVIRRAGNYAIMRPAREMLYVVVTREEKYKAKNFIDTFVYRSGDAVSAWVYSAMRSLGLGLSAIALIAVPVALLWAWIAYRLGRKQQALAHTTAQRGSRHE